MWTTNDSAVHRLGIVGNTLVQVEIDSLTMDGKPVRQTSLHVCEFRDASVGGSSPFTRPTCRSARKSAFRRDPNLRR